MDDHTSRKQIDELAELYLTGVIDGSNTDDSDDAGGPIQGPAPIRLSPKVMPAAPATAPSSPDPDDRHPMLRLTDSAPDERSASETASGTSMKTGVMDQQVDQDDEPAAEAMVEAVLLGNLPGMSGPWLTQYAQLIAQSEGPVALLHVSENAIDLELIEPRAEAEPAPLGTTTAVRIPPMRGNRSGLVGLLDALTRSETAPTRTILVRLDPANDAKTLSRFAALDNWTLLCGSDEASVAGVVQQLRQIVRADPRLSDRSIGLMVMGSDEPSARAAADRVAQDMRGDLTHRVEFIGHLKRMQPVQVREIGSFADPISVWPQLVAWFDTLQAPEPMPAIEAMQDPAPPAPAAPRPVATPASTLPPSPSAAPKLSAAAANLAAPASRPEPRPTFIPTPPAAAPRTSRPAAQRPEPGPQPQQQPQPVAPQRIAASPPAPPRREPHAPTPTRTASPTIVSEPTRPAPQPRVLTPQLELDLVALLAQGTAALRDPLALDARIPDQPDAQLAVDADGLVHVLLKKVSDTFSDDDPASNDPRRQVMQLIEAGRWVREHLELIALTQRERVFVDAEPVLHLLTDRADLATRLVGKLAGQVRLHLLQQVRLGRETGWFCTPLG